MKTLRILIVLLTAAMLQACTQNNGHIGPLFGAWSLESMSCDGEDLPQPEGTYTTWSFQGAVLRVLLSKGLYDNESFYATWERTDQVLTLDFTHSGENTPPGTHIYRAPYWMGFPENEVFKLDVKKLDGSELILNWTSEEGKKYIYNFKKTW